MSKKALRLLVVALLVLGVVTPLASTAGAQTSGISLVCPIAGGSAGVFADTVGGTFPAAYAPLASRFLLPQMANGGVDGKGRTVFDGSLNGFAVGVYVDAAWVAGSNVTLTGFNDYFCGSNGNDVVRGGNGADSIHGMAGDDKLNGQGGNDYVYGGPGNDKVRGAADNDWLFGDDGDDKLYGKRGNDVLFGGPGNDNIKAGADSDVAYGGGAWWGDSVAGYTANGWVTGGTVGTGDADAYDDGVDVLSGEGGSDMLSGGAGADTLKGGSTADVLIGDWADAVPASWQSWGRNSAGLAGLDASGADGLADLFDGGDMIYCGSGTTNLDNAQAHTIFWGGGTTGRVGAGDEVEGGGGTDTSQNDCEVTDAEIQLA